MGAMKDFVMWCEENGHAEWNESTESYEYTTDKTQSQLMKEWDDDIRRLRHTDSM